MNRRRHGVSRIGILNRLDFDLLPAPRAEHARGGVAEDGEFQKARAAPDGEGFAVSVALVREEAPEGANLASADEEASAAFDGFLREVLPRDVGDAVAEAVYVDD